MAENARLVMKLMDARPWCDDLAGGPGCGAGARISAAEPAAEAARAVLGVPAAAGRVGAEASFAAAVGHDAVLSQPEGVGLFRTSKSEIRNPKSEARNKSQAPNSNDDSFVCVFVSSHSVIRDWFGFRASCF
jgi:hypothetical protein